MNKTIEENFEFCFMVRAVFRPARQAPPRTNPSDGLYGDAGDEEEVALQLGWSDVPEPLEDILSDALWESNAVSEHFTRRMRRLATHDRLRREGRH